MGSHHLAIGITLLIATLCFLCVAYIRAPKVAPIAFWGWGGLAIILCSEALLILRIEWVTTFFTALSWTGYLLLIDAMVWSLRGSSRLSQAQAQFLPLAFWSVPLWLIFEAYNLRLRNWVYVGLPQNTLVCGIGYLWAFATIWPAIFETADLLQASKVLSKQESRGLRGTFQTHRASNAEHPARTSKVVAIGVAMVVCPILLPSRLGAYLFGLVWMGFIPLLDPLNERWGGHSLFRDIRNGERALVYSLLASGCICGILWEFWNYWAAAKWLYVFPILQGTKVFQMPAPGYLGFPPFAVECFVMYEFLRTAKNQMLRFVGKQPSVNWYPEKSEDSHVRNQ